MNDRPPQPSLAAPAHRWAVVSLLLGLATACGFALEPHVSLTSLAMVYVLAVAVAAYKLDWIGSSVSAVAAVTALNFFFVPPRWTFEVESQEHFIALTAMLVVALAISHLATGLRRETDIARLNEQRARQLQALATELANAASTEQVLALGRSALEAGFAGPCVLALTQDDGRLDLPKDAEAMAHDGMVCLHPRGGRARARHRALARPGRLVPAAGREGPCGRRRLRAPGPVGRRVRARACAGPVRAARARRCGACA